ncbi:MAG: hypothetical protein E6R03_00420 [Hyphomicrobiaceae bacterium]|nr:MAG: hypothetical protein E6R03_00420 [Hyphomicrobiaceae bacterium]
MRCPDCGKFVSMENGEPEIDIDVFDPTAYPEQMNASLSVQINYHMSRTCADCGQDSLDGATDEVVELTSFPDWANIGYEKQKAVINAIANDEAKIECEADGNEVDESGGGRYAKNMITLSISATITIKVTDEVLGEIILTKTDDFQVEHAASEFEECC